MADDNTVVETDSAGIKIRRDLTREEIEDREDRALVEREISAHESHSQSLAFMATNGANMVQVAQNALSGIVSLGFGFLEAYKDRTASYREDNNISAQYNLIIERQG